MKPQKISQLCAALLPLLAIPAQAVVPNVNVTVNASGISNVVRSDITRTIFGSGVEHQSYRFDNDPGEVMAAGGNPTQTYIKNTIGTLRFPHGTTALHYYWSIPNYSYITRTGVLTSQILTPAEMINYTSSTQLNVERLFQVNTYACKNPTTLVYYQIPDAATPVGINYTNLGVVAQSAADWVTNNLGQVAANRVNYWEVGNEDWSTWTPIEYKDIFNEFSTRMRAAAMPFGVQLKLLIQSYTGNITPPGKLPNTSAWMDTMLNNGLITTNVHAVSEHEYLSTKNYPGDYAVGRESQTRDMFAQVANDTRIPTLKGVLASRTATANWQVWMTEYNLWPVGPDGAVTNLQDVGHAVVMADWTGRLLAQKTDRVFMHGIDDNPRFAMINYTTFGTVAAPKITAPGYAFAKYSQEFGPKLVTNAITGNVSLTPADGTLMSYPQVSVYSSVRESDLTMRVMVINRSTTEGANVTITSNRPISGTRNYSKQTLTSANLTDNNNDSNPVDLVKWSTPYVATSSVSGINALVPKLSATFFIIPLQ